MVRNNKEITYSIVIPLLDAEMDVKDLFISLKKQINVNKKNVEIIIVNDGSTDNTTTELKKHRKLLSDYDSLSIVKHIERQGHTITRIDGAKVAKGKYLIFIDKKGRPDNDYLQSLISKNRNIIIGNPYVNKTRSAWGRVLSLIRIKLYYPYFNHTFDDITLNSDQYAKFKNKGGGGSMFVLRKYYLEVAKTMPTGVHVSDDNLFVLKLAKIEPVLKTSSAKIEYLNRTGFKENIIHLYNRGPKFVSFYTNPGSRFFLLIMGVVAFVILNLVITFFNPILFVYEFCLLATILLIATLYISEDPMDFSLSLVILPIAIASFSIGIIRGLLLMLFRKY